MGLKYPLGPLPGVTSSVAPSAAGFFPRPGFSDWATAPEAMAKETRTRFWYIVAIL